MQKILKLAKPFFIGEILSLIGDELFKRVFADNTPATIEAIDTVRENYYSILSSTFSSTGSLIANEKHTETASPQHLGETLRVILVSSLLMSLATTTFLMFYPNLFTHLLGVGTNDAELFESFLKIYALSIPGNLLREILTESAAYLGAENIISSISFINISTKLFSSYCLFYGKFGLPELQASGLSWAIVISTYISLVHLIFTVKNHNELKKIDFFKFELPRFSIFFEIIKKFINISWPVTVSELFKLLMRAHLSVIIQKININEYFTYKAFTYYESWFSILANPIKAATCIRLSKYCNNSENSLKKRNTISRENYIIYKNINIFLLVLVFFPRFFIEYSPYSPEKIDSLQLRLIFTFALINSTLSKINELSIAQSQVVLSTQLQQIASIIKLTITLYLSEKFIENSQGSVLGLYAASILTNAFFGRFQYRLFQFCSQQMNQNNKQLRNSSLIKKLGIYSRLAFFGFDDREVSKSPSIEI